MSLLQRYILGELVRVFLLMASVLTVLLVFVGVFKEMTDSGLGPLQVLEILPYVVPSMLPFTIPATLLLSVCVVFGRMAGDLEVTASKAAGIHVMTLLWPAFLFGSVLSAGSFLLMDRTIPWAVANIQRTVTSAMEDIFLDALRARNQITNQQLGISVTVTGIRDRTLLTPIFQYTPKNGKPITIKAHEATLRFDLKAKVIWLKLIDGHINTASGHHVRIAEIERPFPLPNQMRATAARHLSIRQIHAEQLILAEEAAGHRDRRDVEAAFALAVGEFDHLLSPEHLAYDRKVHRTKYRRQRINTAIHTRITMAFSCLCFVFVGAPFAVWQGKRQFLSSFFLCFLPILLIYYPVTLLMMNLCKSGKMDPTWAMWIGNALLVAVGTVILRKVIRH